MQTAQRVRALAKELNNSALAGGSLPRLAGTLYYLSAFQSARRSATRGARQTNRLPPRKSARPRLAVCAILMVPCETVRQSVRGRWGGCPANHDGRGLSLQEVLLFLIERKSFATRLGSKGVRGRALYKNKTQMPWERTAICSRHRRTQSDLFIDRIREPQRSFAIGRRDLS